jgi:hypothetical protein
MAGPVQHKKWNLSEKHSIVHKKQITNNKLLIARKHFPFQRKAVD